MGKPFMGIWDPETKLGQATGKWDFKFPAKKGDNNYHDAPEDLDYYRWRWQILHK